MLERKIDQMKKENAIEEGAILQPVHTEIQRSRSCKARPELIQMKSIKRDLTDIKQGMSPNVHMAASPLQRDY